MLPKLLEREGLLSTLKSLLAGAKQGSGSMVLLEGEAGAGKTSVLRALADELPSEYLVLVGGCDPLTTPRPVGPLRDMALAPQSIFDDILDSERELHELFTEVLERLRISRRPVLLIIEDAHWADEGTLDMLTFLGRRIGDSKAVVVVTYRGDEVDSQHPLQPIVGDLLRRRTSVQHLHVDPLSLGAVRQLAESTDHDPALVHRLTAGNAFFVTELLSSHVGLPHTVQEAVMARVSRLSETARSLAEAVSIDPGSVSLDILQEITEVGQDAEKEALAAGVLIGDTSGYRFRHELARLAVEQSIPTPRRMQLHHKMIAALVGTDDEARLAHHAVRTTEPDLILSYAIPAAKDAISRRSQREAVGFFAAAHPFLERMDIDQRLEILYLYYNALSAIDRQLEALDVSSEYLALSDSVADPRVKARGLGMHGRSTWLTGESGDASREISEAISLLEPLGESEDLAYGLYLGAHHLMLDRMTDSAEPLARRCIDMSRRLGLTRTEAIGTLTLGTIEVVRDNREEGVRLLHEAIAMARDQSIPRLELIALGMLGSGGGEIKDYEGALGWLNRCIETGMQSDEDYNVAYSKAWIARIKCEQGKWDECTKFAEEVLELDPSVARISPVTALGALGRMRVRRGEQGGAEVLERAIEMGKNGALQHIWAPLCALAELYWLQNLSSEAVALLTEPFHRIMDTDTPWGRGEIAFWLWLNGGLDEVPENVALPYRLHMEGDWRGAASEWEKIGAPYEEALALASGDEESLLTAVSRFDSLGARPASQWARSRLRAMGSLSIPRAPRRSTRENPAGLTPRQSEVCHLMAKGLDNASIGERLFISKKTVEHHVAAIFIKLDAGSRAEAVARSRDLGFGGEPLEN